MNIAAFDLSLVATGYARNDGESGVIAPTKLIGMPRLSYLREAVLKIATSVAADVVVLEGYAFARPNQAHQLGELGGIIRLALHDRCWPVVNVPPASLKLFATGRGNAKKEEMLAAAIRRLGYQGHDHNVADALWLLKLAEHGLGLAECTNEAQRRALAKITWPELAACL